MYSKVVKPLLKEARQDSDKITELTKELDKTLKTFKILNASIRHPVISEKLQLTCKKKLQNEGIKNIDQIVVKKLTKAGLYNGKKENINKFAKLLNNYFQRPKRGKLAITDGSYEKTLSSNS